MGLIKKGGCLKIVVIIGESGSGKSTLQKMFVNNNPKYKKVVTYTTRPKRSGELDGNDYIYISKEMFDKYINQGFFLEYSQYKGWYYGLAKEDCFEENSVAVLTPAGLRALKRKKIPIISIYLNVDRKSRLINLLTRGDNIEEAYRRSLSDVGQFDGVVEEVDHVIDNEGFHMTPNQVLNNLEEILFPDRYGQTTFYDMDKQEYSLNYWEG